MAGMTEEEAHQLYSRLPSTAQSGLDELRRTLAQCGAPAVSVFTIEPACWSPVDPAPRDALLARVREQYPPKRAVIYSLDATGADPEACGRAFREAKAGKIEGRAFARDNGCVGPCLYVGSSHDLAERLSWHLGFGHPSRSALQLAHWASVIQAPLVLSVAAYSPDLPTGTLQCLEDSLWDEMRPMFGRRGAR
jgi:hypothetical protein